MKILPIVLAIIFVNIAYCELLRPLWEEDSHFICYRTIQIESTVYRIEDQIEKIDLCQEDRQGLENEIKILKYNLGLCEL